MKNYQNYSFQKKMSIIYLTCTEEPWGQPEVFSDYDQAISYCQNSDLDVNLYQITFDPLTGNVQKQKLEYPLAYDPELDDDQ